MRKERIDLLLVEQGFFDTREKARRHIMAGVVLADDKPIDKAGTKVPVTAHLRIKGQVMPYVGRGGYKLEKALCSFCLDLEGAVMVDIGASTGGFTDCALQHGAKKVFAVDVGRNQLDWKIRSDPRVMDWEKTNIKDVTAETLGEQADFIATDISFISVCQIIPACLSLLKDTGNMVILIKPQFEAGREKVGKGGIVRDPAVHTEVICRTSDVFANNGFFVHGLTWSPIKGSAGNIEFLAHLKRNEPPKNFTLDQEAVEAVVKAAHQNLEGNTW